MLAARGRTGGPGDLGPGMSVWDRIRWVNVGRAVLALAALAVIVAWPRLAAPPPAVPDGTAVPVAGRQLPPTPETPVRDRIPALEENSEAGTDTADERTRRARRLAARGATRGDRAGRGAAGPNRRAKGARRRQGARDRFRSRRERRARTGGSARRGRGGRTRRERMPDTAAPSPTATRRAPVAAVVGAPVGVGAIPVAPRKRPEFGFER